MQDELSCNTLLLVIEKIGKFFSHLYYHSLGIIQNSHLEKSSLKTYNSYLDFLRSSFGVADYSWILHVNYKLMTVGSRGDASLIVLLVDIDVDVHGIHNNLNSLLRLKCKGEVKVLLEINFTLYLSIFDLIIDLISNLWQIFGLETKVTELAFFLCSDIESATFFKSACFDAIAVLLICMSYEWNKLVFITQLMDNFRLDLELQLLLT